MLSKKKKKKGLVNVFVKPVFIAYDDAWPQCLQPLNSRIPQICYIQLYITIWGMHDDPFLPILMPSSNA